MKIKFKLSRHQLRMRAKSRKKQAKLNNELPKLSSEEQRMLHEIRVKIYDVSAGKLGLREALHNYIRTIGKKKTRLDKPKIILGKLDIKKDVEDMGYLYKLIRAVYAEYVLGLEIGKVPYSVLAALPKRNLVEIWESANKLKEGRPHPSENDIAEAKKTFKVINYDEVMAKHAAYLDDIPDLSEDEDCELKDRVSPNLKQDILSLSRESPMKSRIMLNIFKYFNEDELLRILGIMKNFTSTEIEEMINKLQEEYLIVTDFQSDFGDSHSHTPDVSEVN